MARIKKKILSVILISIFVLNLFVLTILNSYLFTSNSEGYINSVDEISTNYQQDPSYYNDYHKFYYDFDKNLTPLQILTVINEQPNSFFDEFAMLASIPYTIFVEDQLHKVSPLIYDNLNNNTRQFLSEWNEYNNYFDGVKRIIYVGDVESQVRAEIENLTDFDATDKADRPVLNFTESSIYDLAASFASFFWGTTDTIVLAIAPESEFTNNVDVLPVINDEVNSNNQSSLIGILSSSDFVDYYNSTNVTLTGGAYLININTTNNINLDLIGNQSDSNNWIFDTTNFTNNNWVFVPNLTYPANSSDWALKVSNSSNVGVDIPYNLTFYNISGNYHNLKINSSNAKLSISLTWSDPTDDLDIWVLNPNGQLMSYSDRNGFLYNESSVNETSESAEILYPEVGNWQIIVTSNKNSSTTSYNIQYTVTNFSKVKENITLSAANAAVIGSIIHAPLLYTNGITFTDDTKEFINNRNTSNTMDVIIVDLNGSININSLNQSLDAHFGAVTYLNNYSMIAEFINNMTGLQNVTLTSINEDQYGAAAVYSAFKGNYLLPTLNESTDFLSYARSNYKIMENGYYQSPLNQFPSFDNMSECSSDFYNWLDSIQTGYNNRSITIFSSLTDLYPTFDRAIIGKSRVGRFSFNNASDNLVSAQRNIFYPLFSYINETDAQDTIYSNATIIDADFQDDDSIISGMSTENWQLSLYFNDRLEEKDNLYLYANNNSQGLFPCFGINLSLFDFSIANISSLSIEMRAKTNISDSSINQAGWAIWNWTDNNYTIVNDTVFNNSGSFQDDTWSFSGNMSHFINETENNRLEVFFIANHSNPGLQAQVDFLKINITFEGEFAKQFVLFSNISSMYNFTFNQTDTHNYSVEIPNMFLNQGYNSTNATSYSNVIGNLSNQMALWYHSGIGSIENLSFVDIGNMSFDNGNTWKTGMDFLNDLSTINSTLNFLNDDYLASTKIPEYLQSLGSTSIISNLGKNILGYSEEMFYQLFQELNSNEMIGDALIKGLNATSHLYSLNDAENVIEVAGDPLNSEDYHQFILFGDPDLQLVENSSFLLKPGNYKPIVRQMINYTYRKTATSVDIQDYGYSLVYFDLIDIDSKIPTSSAYFTLLIGSGLNQKIGSVYGYTSENINGHDYNFKVQINLPASGTYPAQLGIQNTELTIYDGADQVIVNSKINILSDAPIFWQYHDPENYGDYIGYNDIGAFIPEPLYYDQKNISNFIIQNATGLHYLPYDTMPVIGRVDETLHAFVVVGDLDWQDIDPPPGLNTYLYMDVNVCLQHVGTGTWINLTSTINESISTYNGDGENGASSPHGRSLWYVNYTFTEIDNFGLYNIYIHSVDKTSGHGMIDRIQKVEFINITAYNWPVELNFSTEFPYGFKNNSDTIWRLNETLQINATFIDRDDYDPYGQVSSYLSVEGNETITNELPKYNTSYGNQNYTKTDDTQYHVFSNNSDGLIYIPYYINLTNQGINFNNITSMNITSTASISISNDNISYAGWRIWNWTANDYYEISNNSFNSTSMSTDIFYYNGNLTHFINITENNRIEIFFVVNMTQNSTLNLSIDYIGFNIINNRTGIQATLCLKHNSSSTTYWINQSMIYYQRNLVWNTTYRFTNVNLVGTWYIYFHCTDKDEKTVDICTGKNITVLNHVPNFVNLTLLDDSDVYRTNGLTFRSNATDYDVYNKSANLTHVLIFHSFVANTTFNYTMNYNDTLDLWNYTWTPATDAVLGNYSVNLTVIDEASGINSTLLIYNITVLNNKPNITLLSIIPSDYQFFENEIIVISVNFSDIELLLNYSIKIRDDEGNWKNATYGPLIGLNTFLQISLDPDFYDGLTFQNNWSIYIILMDSDLDSINLTISIRVYPQYQPPATPQFPWELVVILGLVITAILASLLVYRFRQKEEEEVPVSRVKAIIKKISDERKLEEEKEQALIAEHEKKELIKKHVKGDKVLKNKRKITPETKELDKLERKNLEVRLSETLANARTAIKKENYRYAGELYQRAAKIASKLGDMSKSSRFSEQAENYFKKAKSKSRK